MTETVMDVCICLEGCFLLELSASVLLNWADSILFLHSHCMLRLKGFLWTCDRFSCKLEPGCCASDCVNVRPYDFWYRC